MSKGFFNLLHTKIGIYHGPVIDVEISPRVLVKWYITAEAEATATDTVVDDQGARRLFVVEDTV